MQPKRCCQLIGKIGGANFGDGKATGGDHQGTRLVRDGICFDGPAIWHSGQIRDGEAELMAHLMFLALMPKHVDDVLGGVVAK